MRVCPLCLVKVPAGQVVTYSNDLQCPGCKAQLDIAPASRYISIVVGLTVGVSVWHVAGQSGELGWVLPLVCGFIAFGIVSPVVLMLIADLRVKPPGAVQEPEHAAAEPETAHGPSHH